MGHALSLKSTTQSKLVAETSRIASTLSVGASVDEAFWTSSTITSMQGHDSFHDQACMMSGSPSTVMIYTHHGAALCSSAPRWQMACRAMSLESSLYIHTRVRVGTDTRRLYPRSLRLRATSLIGIGVARLDKTNRFPSYHFTVSENYAHAVLVRGGNFTTSGSELSSQAVTAPDVLRRVRTAESGAAATSGGTQAVGASKARATMHSPCAFSGLPDSLATVIRACRRTIASRKHRPECRMTSGSCISLESFRPLVVSRTTTRGELPTNKCGASTRSSAAPTSYLQHLAGAAAPRAQ